MNYLPMSKRMKIKIALLVVIVVGCLVGTGFLLSGVQQSLSLAGYTDEMRQQTTSLKATLRNADKETQASKDSFDETFASKAAAMAYLANNDTGFERTDAQMRDYRKLFGVDNVFLVSKDGTILAKSGDTKADFSYSRYNRLRSVFETGKPSAAVEITLPDKDWNERYYSAKIDDDTMGVLEMSPKRMDDIVDANSSLTATLKDITVGQDGYVMAVSAKDYTVQYHPNDRMMGVDALDHGLNVADLENGHFFHMTFDGEKLYAESIKIGDMYYIASVPEQALSASRNVTVGVILFVAAVVMASVVLYGVFVMRDDERRGHEAADEIVAGPVLVNKKVASKAVVLSVVGLVVVTVVSFYMQTLFALSNESMVNSDRASSIAQTMSNTSKRAAAFEKEFNTRYLNKARIVAYALDHNPKLADRAKLVGLADDLKVDMVSVFNADGVRTASTEPDRGFTLSKDPSEQSYAFRRLLQGADSLVQSPGKDESTGQLRQYIGVPTYDDNGMVTGLVQIAVHPKMLDDMLSSIKIDAVLSGVQVGDDGFAFAIDKKTGRIAYFPDELVQGKAATKVGMKTNQIKGGFSDYLTIDGKSYYASSVETPDYYLYVTGGDSELMAERMPLSAITAATAALCQLLIFLVLVLDPRRELKKIEQADAEAVRGGDAPAAVRNAAAKASDRDQTHFTVDRPGANGRGMRTQSAASRWMNQAFDWSSKTPEGKLATVLRFAAALFVLMVFVAVMFQDEIFGSRSVFAYILGGGWNKGLNVFAITGALMSACVIVTVATVVQEVLKLLSRVTGARGETMIRLLNSVIKYGTVIGILYYSLSLIGVDTATLLASAGLLTLAIGFGAQQLVSDILSGLFIIFEGEFRVGDVIQVGTSNGTVLEIGVRTTKIDDGSGNILVLRNSMISNVINKTKLDSYASVDVDLNVGENLVYVENILSKELPNIARRLPAVLDGPFYKGVVGLTPTAMTIRVVARCAERDRVGLELSLKREMRLLLTRNNISPYKLRFDHEEDIRLSEAKKREEERELQEADEFVNEQKEASDDIGNEGSTK